ncbi:double-stranded DNA-binding domain-containing protein [Calycina marina]|uniref:Double-stranded DNA-binding domain-containing protein n=1 Tax=Calycina marina TaxID=1763456 RepID=A0A9P7Z2T3_9HELO|nr:double-stranded DNA-binding domain-containing protein [Calycina marina]
MTPAKDLAEFSPEIHILGTGPVGLHLAHALRGSLNPPPVTLLLHRPLLIQQWHEEGACINVVKDGVVSTRSDFNIESASTFGLPDGSPDQAYPGFGPNLVHTVRQPSTKIENLIVTTRVQQTVAALDQIKARLGSHTNICLVNCGVGIVEDINTRLFPDPFNRPSYMLATNSHKIYPINAQFKYSAKIQKPGQLIVTMLNDRERSRAIAVLYPAAATSVECSKKERSISQGWSATARYLMRTLRTNPELDATGWRHGPFMINHLQDLAINSVLGPLSVMFNTTLDKLTFNYEVTEILRYLLSEISQVILETPEQRYLRSALSQNILLHSNSFTQLHFKKHSTKQPQRKHKMEDDELAQIRAARLQQMKAESSGNGRRQASSSGPSSGQGDDKQNQEAEARASILAQILQPEAADRLGRIRLVKTSRAEDIENRLIMLAKSGQLRAKVTEEHLKELLGAVSETKEEKKIVVTRRKGWEDDDDLLDL